MYEGATGFIPRESFRCFGVVFGCRMGGGDDEINGNSPKGLQKMMDETDENMFS